MSEIGVNPAPAADASAPPPSVGTIIFWSIAAFTIPFATATLLDWIILSGRHNAILTIIKEQCPKTATNSSLCLDPSNSAYSAMSNAGGDYAKFVTYAAAIFIVAAWVSFTAYVLWTRTDDDCKDNANAYWFILFEALHEPAGDIFTLIGISFTFFGLGLSMVSLPYLQLYHVVAITLADASDKSPPIYTGLADDPLEVVAATLVFGSSLAIGLVASLLGVMLSVSARGLSAVFSKAVPPPSHVSRGFGTLVRMAAVRPVA